MNADRHETYEESTVRLDTYFVNIPPARPNGESLARLSASSSVSNANTDMTLPNTSSRTTVMSSVHLLRMQGVR